MEEQNLCKAIKLKEIEEKQQDAWEECKAKISKVILGQKEGKAKRCNLSRAYISNSTESQVAYYSGPNSQFGFRLLNTNTMPQY